MKQGRHDSKKGTEERMSSAVASIMRITGSDGRGSRSAWDEIEECHAVVEATI